MRSCGAVYYSVQCGSITLNSVDKILNVTIQIRVLGSNFLWFNFVLLFKVALTFEPVDEILKCNHSYKSY